MRLEDYGARRHARVATQRVEGPVPKIGVDEKPSAKGNPLPDAGLTQELLNGIDAMDRREPYIQATRAQVPEAAKTVRLHIDIILTYYQHPVTNTMREGLNSQIQ